MLDLGLVGDPVELGDIELLHSDESSFPVEKASLMHWLSNMDFTKADLVTATTEYPMPASITSNESPVWHYSPAWLINYWWQVGYIGPLSSWKGHHFVLTGTDTYPEYGFSFPTHNASSKTAIHGLTECLPLSWYYTQHCFFFLFSFF